MYFKWGWQKASHQCIRDTSQRQKSIEQQNRKPSNIMPDLSQGRTHERWNVGNQWIQEPDIPRVAVGVTERVNRLKALGNAIVPQVAYEIFETIKAINEEY